MSRSLVLRGGRVVCAETGRDTVADVVVSGDKISTIGAGPTGDMDVVDARGCLVLPGLIDLGVHLRDPGREHDEDLASTLRAALRGGVTTFVALPDTLPAVDGADDVLHRRAAATRALGDAAAPHIVVAGSLTRRREGKEPADVADMTRAGVEVFTDAAYIEDDEVLRRSLEYARGAGARLAILSGPVTALSRGVVVESPIASRLGLPSVPELADSLAAFRHVHLGRLAGLPVHIGPLFTKKALDVLDGATAEVNPWHLLLDERAHLERRYDTLLRLDPPLPTAESRAALLDAVRRGVLCVSSGHRAVPNRTKDLEFAIAEAGASTLALTLPLLCGVLSPMELARATSALPARILGLSDRGKIDIGARADLVVLRSDQSDVVDARLCGSRSPANPWLGLRTHGRVEATIAGGRIAYSRDNA